MSRIFHWIIPALLAAGPAGCDLFVSDRGGAGQPCFGNQTCSAGLECVEGTCRFADADGRDGGDDGADPGGDEGADLDGGDGGAGCVDQDGDRHDKRDPVDCPTGTDYCDDDPFNHTSVGCTECSGNDLDGDHYGVGCDLGPDCNEDDFTVHSGCDVARFYRSVGPGNEGVLAQGGANTMTIVQNSAHFQQGLPGNIGVGDTIIYDTGSDGSPDYQVVIHQRMDSQNFVVTNPPGGSAVDTAEPTQAWAVYRAYTSLRSALAFEENPGLPSGFDNFDSVLPQADMRNLVARDRIWSIACYGDAVDTEALENLENWTTDADRYLRIFTPVTSDEAGASQRHDGKWSQQAYTLQCQCSDYDSVITIGANMTVYIDGLQIQKVGTAGTPCMGVDIVNDAVVYLSNNIIR
jgi:hypothetical protein